MMRVAVLGLGYFSQLHLEAWHTQERAEVVLGVDPDPKRRAWARERFGMETAEALDDRQVDVLDIVAPPHAHRDLLGMHAQKGRLLICQKPFCRSLEEAQQVADAIRAKGAELIIHENFRFQPWYRALKGVLDRKELGQIYGCRFHLRPGDGQGARAYLDRQPGFQTMERLLIHETGVHFIDLFRWLFGPVEGVYADLRRLNPVIAGEDAGLLVLTHASGVQSVFDGNRLSDHASDNPRRTMGEMVLEAEHGVVRLDGQGRLWKRRKGESREEEIAISPPWDDDSFGGGCVKALIDHVVTGWIDGTPLENAVQDYLPVIALSEAAYRSAKEGRKIDMKGSG